MIAQALDIYQDSNPKNHNYDWFNTKITDFRLYWRPVINPIRANENRKILLSTFDLAKVKAMFKDKVFLRDTVFVPVATWEKIRNVLISEIHNNPPVAKIKAVDPSALLEKKKDLMKLKNRGIIENDLTKSQTAVGLPPYKMPYDKFNSNVEEFDQMGLDPNSPDDVSFFEKTHHKLFYEVRGQSLVNSIFLENKFDEYITKFVNDILAVKCCCSQAFVSKITGAIKYRYLYPEVCYGILGTRADNADAKCLGYQDSVNLGEFLEQVGDEFNWERDWKELLWALNFRNNLLFTGFIRNGITYDTCIAPLEGNNALGANNVNTVANSNLLNWDNAYNFDVYMGYIEWKTWIADTYKINKNNGQAFSIDYDYKLKENSSYQKTSWYKETLYGAVFLATGTTSQRPYCCGKVYHQLSNGQYDEYAGYTLSFYREEGLSAVEISIPYINLANQAFYKMMWAVGKAKPDSDVFWIEEMIEVSKGMDKLAGQTPGVANQVGFQQKLEQIIQFEKENALKIRAYPKIDGKTNPNPPSTNDKKHNGLDPVAVAMQAVVDWAEAQITNKVGINSLREGQTPDERDGYKINAAATDQSRNATGYVDRLIRYHMEHTGTITTLYAQDIINYKDTLPYEWLLKLSGDETIEAIKQLGDFAAHRYGIFIKSYNTQKERAKVEQLADIELQQGNIDVAQWAVLMMIDDFGLAVIQLAYMKQTAEKKKAKEAQIQQQNIMAIQAQKHKDDMELVTTKGQIEITVAQIDYKKEITVAQIQAGSKVSIKQMGIESNPEIQQDRANSQKEVITHKAETEQQSALA